MESMRAGCEEGRASERGWISSSLFNLGSQSALSPSSSEKTGPYPVNHPSYFHHSHQHSRPRSIFFQSFFPQFFFSDELFRLDCLLYVDRFKQQKKCSQLRVAHPSINLDGFLFSRLLFFNTSIRKEQENDVSYDHLYVRVRVRVRTVLHLNKKYNTQYCTA